MKGNHKKMTFPFANTAGPRINTAEKIKFYLLTITLFIFNAIGISQSLSIPETIDYLNKILIQSAHQEEIRPLKLYDDDKRNYSHADYNRLEQLRILSDSGRHVYVGCNVITSLQISIDKYGFLVIKKFITATNCKEEKNNVQYELRESVKINVDDIDLEKMTIYFPKNDKSWMFELNDNINDCGSINLVCVDKDVKCIHYENKYGEYNWDNLQFQTKFKIAAYTINVYSEDFSYDIKRFYNALTFLISSANEQGYHRQRNEKDDPFVDHTNNSNGTSISNSIKKYKVPLKENTGVFSLTVNLNGQTFSFILDSGAGECNISPDTEDVLLSKGLIKNNNYLSNGLYKLADGSIVECKRVKIPKIIVGNKIVYNVIASIGQKGSPNLLGQSFLNKTIQWTIDNSKRSLILQ